MALFWLANAMSQHLFPSRVALIFRQVLVLMMGESGRCVKPSPALWWPIHVWKWCLMLPEPLFHNLSPKNSGIVILEYARANREEKIHWWKHLVILYIQSVSWPNFWAINAAELDLTKPLSDLRSPSFKIFSDQISSLKMMVPHYPSRFKNALDNSNFSSFSNLLSCFLCLMQANDLTLLKPSYIFPMTTGHGCLRNEKLLTASVKVQ